MHQRDEQPEQECSWFKAMRHDDAPGLLKTNPLALALAWVIAYRARWKDGFNRNGLGPGEAMLGDFENYGMTMRQYRTAKEQLAKWGFAAFKATTHGTVAKLLDSRLFFVSTAASDNQNAKPATNGRQSNDKRATTNLESLERKKERRGKAAPPFPSELRRLIKEQRELIIATPQEDPRMPMYLEKLNELETLKHGAPRTTLAKLHKPKPSSQDPKRAGVPVADVPQSEWAAGVAEMRRAANEGATHPQRPDRNEGTCNYGVDTSDLQKKVR